MFLGRRGPCERLSAIATSMAVEPQDMYGTDTCCLGHHTEIKPGQTTGCLWRRDPPNGKMQEIRS
jgi:hypothetical protein